MSLRLIDVGQNAHLTLWFFVPDKNNSCFACQPASQSVNWPLPSSGNGLQTITLFIESVSCFGHTLIILIRGSFWNFVIGLLFFFSLHKQSYFYKIKFVGKYIPDLLCFEITFAITLAYHKPILFFFNTDLIDNYGVNKNICMFSYLSIYNGTQCFMSIQVMILRIRQYSCLNSCSWCESENRC